MFFSLFLLFFLPVVIAGKLVTFFTFHVDFLLFKGSGIESLPGVPLGLWLQGLPLRHQLVLGVRTEQRLHQLLAVLRGDGGVVEFLHLRQGLEHLVALVGQLGHRVVEQPEHLQFLELHELLDFGEVADQILAQVDLG